jgi:hypothetical protein
MRVTVSHDKGKEEATRIVNQATDQILRPLFAGPLQMSDVRKQWNGSTLDFSLTASVSAALAVPIKGSIIVTEREITIECALPAFLDRLLPEIGIKAGVEAAVRGLLK